MSSQVDQYVSLYREISAVPSVTSANLVDQNDCILSIYSNWSAKDLITMEKTVFSRNYVYDYKNSKVISAGRPYDISSVCRQAFSRCGKKQAVFREKKSQTNCNDGCDLEIWNEYQKLKTVELTDTDEHGKVNTNAFGCLEWSSDGRYLLYTAEAKRPKSVSYFKNLKVDNEDNRREGKKQIQGNEYVYREEWGEDFVGSHHSVLVIVDIITSKLEVVDRSNEEISIGEAIWGPDDKTIVFVGYKEFPRRLGVRSCPNRSCAIYAYDRQTKKIERLSGEKDTSVRCPRFSPDFKSLIYLENEIGGPHFKASKLQKCDWESRKISTVVNTIDCPQVDEFPGLYVTTFPKNCWFKNYVFLTSQWRSYLSILCINTDNGNVQKIEPKMPLHPDGTGEIFGACTVLNVHKNLIIAELSSINIEPCLALGCIKKDNTGKIEWKYLDSNAPVKHNDVEWKIVKMNEHKADLYFEVILTVPTHQNEELENIPAIIRPHGGPHAAYSAAFTKNILGFTKLKYINCLVNYRGSMGFGENFLNSLPGNVGTLDVDDVQQTAVWLKSLPIPVTDVSVIGGSHGGFLGAHLVGQYPNFYSAAVLLNPVIDIAGMTETTDIPDWNYVEGGCGNLMDLSTVLTPESLNSMWEKSPIKYAENIKTPVLFLLGSKDLRVPYSQGLKLYRLLKARKVPVSIYVYEDNHSLQKTPHDADLFMQTILWLEKHSQNSS